MSRRNYLSNDFAKTMWDDLFSNAFWPMSTRKTETMRKTDIKEDENAYSVIMDLPGFKKDEINAELKNGYLTVTATHNSENETEDQDKHYICKERYSGHYSRSFYVGDEVNEDDIQGAFSNGVLTLSIPKKLPQPETETKKTITIS